jgi:hypothetical protein
MTSHQAAPLPSPAKAPSSRGFALQKKCACGGHGAGRCMECEARDRKAPSLASSRRVESLSRGGGRVGHDFGRLSVYRDNEQDPAQASGALTARRRLMGQAACNPEQGVVLPSVFKEHCAGDCVAQHEERHVADMSLCCERYGRCHHRGAGVSERNKCRDAWIDWWNHIDAWTECNAYTTEHACLRDLLQKNCAPGSGPGDDPCCQELQKEFLGVEGRIAEYCPKSLPWPCPFGEDGTITKI